MTDTTVRMRSGLAFPLDAGSSLGFWDLELSCFSSWLLAAPLGLLAGLLEDDVASFFYPHATPGLVAKFILAVAQAEII